MRSCLQRPEAPWKKEIPLQFLGKGFSLQPCLLTPSQFSLSGCRPESQPVCCCQGSICSPSAFLMPGFLPLGPGVCLSTRARAENCVVSPSDLILQLALIKGVSGFGEHVPFFLSFSFHFYAFPPSIWI